MRIFITGATGFVGQHIAARLIEDGHKLSCLVRSTEAEEVWYLDGIGADIFVGDILAADSLAAGIAGCDAVIHLVGVIYERRNASFEQIHVEGTGNVLAAAKQAGVGRFVHMSALGTRAGAAATYHRTKWDAEEKVRQSGLEYTIFRPSTIYGPGGDFINLLAGHVRRLPVVPVIGDGNYRMQPISVFDVAACFSSCLGRTRAACNIYEIGGPEALSYNEMIDTICHVLDKRRRKVHIPVALVRPVAWVGERIVPWPLLTTDQLTMLLEDNVCDISDMRQDLGVEPEPFASGLHEALHTLLPA